MVVAKHYCEGNLISVSVDKEPFSCCAAMDNCCHNEFSYLQVKDDFSVPVNQINVETPVLDVLVATTFLFYSAKPVVFENNEIRVDTSPPPIETPEYLSLLQTYLC